MSDLKDDLRTVAEWMGWKYEEDRGVWYFKDKRTWMDTDYFLTGNGMVELMNYLWAQNIYVDIGNRGRVVIRQAWDAWKIEQTPIRKHEPISTRDKPEALVRATARMIRETQND